MISADLALQRIFEIVPEIEQTEVVSLFNAVGRVLAVPIRSNRDQPPFDASAMDGFAVNGSVGAGTSFRVVGESAAGCGFHRPLEHGESVRIFTGAPVPANTSQIILRENATVENERLFVAAQSDASHHIRPMGTDFAAGHELSAPRIISPEVLALIASMNVPEVEVVRRPVVAIIPTGNELRMPGDSLAEHEIVSSCGFGLLAMLSIVGADARLQPIARDCESSLVDALELAADADLIVTMGGVSAGDHDLVVPVARKLGMLPVVHKVAMRPGKPLLAGCLFGKPFVGLPGNPVSAMVCSRLFLVPAIHAMLRLGKCPAYRGLSKLANPIGSNGPREHFMRAKWQQNCLETFIQQDSSLLTVLAKADALVVRPANDPKKNAGDKITFISLNFLLDTNKEQH